MSTTSTHQPSPDLVHTGRHPGRDPQAPGKTAPAALQGARDITPVLLGVLPLAVIIGVAARDAGIDRWPAWAASFLLCAGAAQLSAIQLLGAGAAPITIVATVALINARFVLYSAGIARWFEHEPLWRRAMLALPLVDQLYIVCQRRFAEHDESPERRRSYYLGAAGTLVLGWSVTQAAAIVLLSSLPGLGVLQYAAPLAFVGLLAATVRQRPQLMAAGVGAITALATAGVPFHLNLAIGIAAGIGAATLAERSS